MTFTRRCEFEAHLGNKGERNDSSRFYNISFSNHPTNPNYSPDSPNLVGYLVYREISKKKGEAMKALVKWMKSIFAKVKYVCNDCGSKGDSPICSACGSNNTSIIRE